MSKSNGRNQRRLEMGAHRHPRSIAKPEESFAVIRPDLLEEYRGSWDPKTVKTGSEFYADWQCRTCGHSWSACVASRAILNSGCPECGKIKRRASQSTAPYKKSLAYRFPELLKEYRGEFDPKKLHARTNKEVDWECCKCGNKWKACVSSRSSGHGCEECGKKEKIKKLTEAPYRKSLAYKFPNIAIEYMGPKDTRKIYAGANAIAEWECSTCSHKWTALICERTGKRKNGCKECKKTMCFDRKKDSFLYLIYRRGQFKVGIMNCNSTRMLKHSEKKWGVVEKIMMSGCVAKAAESQIKKLLKDSNIPTGRKAFREKFDGWNEAWQAVDLDVTSIDDLLEKLGTSFEALLAC